MSDAGGQTSARVCVPVCVKGADELPAALARAARFADVLEVRFDCLEASEPVEALRRLAEVHAPRPLLYTFRMAAQGGHRELDAHPRLDFWARAAELDRAPAFVDLELDLFDDSHAATTIRALGDRATLVCSHHDFAGTPADLDLTYEKMATTPARLLKIAVRAKEITDCLAMLRLLERARADGRALIAVSMGEAGLLTRVLGPARGSFLTYAAPEAGRETAPGQTTARELVELYRVRQLGRQTLITGLVGSPVAHSLSPHMHNAAFAALGVDAVYIPFEVADLAAFVRRMADPRTRELEWNLRGFSVTAPHKQAVVSHLDRLGLAAAAVGAVNTVTLEGDELVGDNTDAAASVRPLLDRLTLRGARAAVVGAGGAARALLWALHEEGARATVFAREPSGAREVADSFGAEAAALDGARFAGFDLVVNATPLGTRGAREEETPATAAQLRGARLAYDLVYNPSETRFLREARAAGCDTLGGLDMLVAQAAEQFKIWTGAAAPSDVMRAAAEERLKHGALQ